MSLNREDNREFARSGGTSRLKYCVWEITLKCDLGCKHCGSRAGKARETELSTDECLDVVAQMADLGFQEVTLIGGEAYLREDWDVIAKAITDAGMFCTITTGGRGFNEERIARAVAAGVDGVTVSIDGLEATHNAQRGTKDAYRRAVQTAERVAASSMHLGANTQINRLSLPELAGVADLLIALGVEAWQVQLTVPMGNAADRPELLLQPHEMLELFPLLAWLKTERLTPNGIEFFPGNNIGYFSAYEPLIRYGGQSGTHFGGCQAGTSCIGVESDGKIKGCPSLPSDEWTGGLSTDSRLRDVLQTDELTRLGKRTREDLWGFCGTCEYGDVCKAGCTWTAQTIMGRPGNNPYCIHRALAYEEQGLREELRRVEAAPGVPFDHGRFETILVPLDDDAQRASTIAGFPLETVTTLTRKSAGLLDREERKNRLRVID